MKKYDIGILTFWNVPNYGTYAQAYALQRVIQSLDDKKDVRQIAHLDQKHYNLYYDKRLYYRSLPFWRRSYWKSFFMKDEINENKKNLFLDAYSTIPHTEIITKKNVEEYRFNKIFLGSAIIWDYTIAVFNQDSMFFGEGLNALDINSYAASFGTVKKDLIIPKYVRNNIKRMKNISVRDENSADIVELITGKRPLVVLDPAWIWDFNNDRNIITPKEDKYILIYGQDFSKGFIDNLIKYAKEKRLKLIGLDCNEDDYSWCDKMIKQENLDPLSWIGYFKGASAVATSTFHGLTFSLIFNKKIAFCKTEFIIAKIGHLLKQLGIYNLFEDKEDVYTMFDYNWDYKFINEYISKSKGKSIEFLRKCVTDTYE